MRDGLRTVSVLSIAHAASVLSGIATTAILTRYLPQEAFGQYRIVLSFLGIAAAFCQQGVGQAIIMSASMGYDGNLARLVRSKILANALGSLAITVVGAYYVWRDAALSPIAAALLIAALCFPAYNLADVWSQTFNGKSRFELLARSRVLTSLVGLGCAASIALLGITNAWAATLVYLAALGALNLTLVRFALALRSNAKENSDLVRFGHQVTIAVMFNSLLSLDTIMLERAYSSNEVAVYAIVLLFPDQVKSIFSIVIQTLAPKIMAGTSFRDLWRTLRRTYFRLSLAFLLLGIVGFFLLPPVTTLLFSEKYSEASIYGSWLWLTISALGSTSILGYALTARQKLVSVYGTNVGHPLVLFGLYYLGVDYGIEGLVAARIIATTVLAIFFVTTFFYFLLQEKAQGDLAVAPATTGEKGHE